MWSKKAILRYVLIALVVCVIAALMIPQARIPWRISNGLFCAGLLLLCIGGFGFIKYLGAFDLITYTAKKLSKYSKKNIDNPDVADVGQYHDYLRSKRRNKDFLIPVCIGSAALCLSALFALVG